MAGFQGADTDQLREHAALMRERSASLEGLRTRLSMLVTHGAEWEGADAEAFRDRWHSEIAPTLDQQIDAIGDRGSSLEDEADQQDEASESDEAPGLFETLSTLASSGQGLFKAFKTFKGLIDDFPGHMKDWKSAFEQGPGALWKKYKTDLAEGLGKALNKGEEYSSIAKRLLGEAGLPDSIGNWDPLKKHLDDGKFPSFLADTAPKLAKFGKIAGKAIPGLDIGLGLHQMATGETTFDRVSGGLSAVGGGLVLAAPLFGPAAPVVAGIGAAAGVVSIGMDLGKLAWDHREAIGDAASAVADGVSDAASNAAESIGDGLESAGDAVKDVGGKVGDVLGFG